MLFLQRTVADSVEMKGKGLHTGSDSSVTFRPAPPNTGIVFVVPGPDGPVEIPARVENVPAGHGGSRNTTLARDGVEIRTVEHVLSVLSGLGVSNCYVDISGGEPPEPADGSVESFVELLDSVGVVEQGLPCPYHRIGAPVSYRDGDVWLRAEPADTFKLTFSIDYDDPLIGSQTGTFTISPKLYRDEIATARTFALKKDVEKLQEMGLAMGGTLDNALVVDNGKVISNEGLRFPDEFVRHKVLDLIGDLSLLGMPILGHITASRSGHDANVAFTRLLAKAERRSSRIYPPRNPDHWDICSIMHLMPHRYPFLLVDRIVELECGKHVIGYKNVTINEPFFQGHFPDHPIMPAVLLIEAMAQVGGVLLLSSVQNSNEKLVYFSGIDQARFRKPVVPGDQVRFELEMVKMRGPVCKMRGTAYVDGDKVAEADLMSSVVDR